MNILVAKLRAIWLKDADFLRLAAFMIVSFYLVIWLIPDSLHWTKTTNDNGIVTTTWFDLRGLIVFAVALTADALVSQVRGKPIWRDHVKGFGGLCTIMLLLWLLFHYIVR